MSSTGLHETLLISTSRWPAVRRASLVTQSSSNLKFLRQGPSFLSGQDPIPKQTPPILCVVEDTILVPIKKRKSHLSLNRVRPLEHVVNLLEVVGARDDSRSVALRLEVLLQMRLLAQITQLKDSIST